MGGGVASQGRRPTSYGLPVERKTSGTDGEKCRSVSREQGGAAPKEGGTLRKNLGLQAGVSSHGSVPNPRARPFDPSACPRSPASRRLQVWGHQRRAAGAIRDGDLDSAGGRRHGAGGGHCVGPL